MPPSRTGILFDPDRSPRYYGASSRDDVHTLQSVSKSITSLFTGIAADMGSVDPDATLLSILPRYADASTDPRLPRHPATPTRSA
jgi:CubicO group peptidase (beta-lactamase class C family)